ncbi:MAG: hypothetical protein ACK2UK_20950 [Candidatus Promineifilaceae bacterium]
MDALTVVHGFLHRCVMDGRHRSLLFGEINASFFSQEVDGISGCEYGEQYTVNSIQ